MDGAGRRGVLVLRSHDRASAVAPLVERLQRRGAVCVADHLDALLDLGGVEAVFADWPSGELPAEHADRLARHVDAGGTVVFAGATLATWSSQRRIADLAGWTPDGRTVETELRFRPRDGAAFAARDVVHLLPQPPADAELLLTAAYRHRDHVVAYARRWGEGQVVFLGVGRNPDALSHPEVQRLVIAAVQPARTTEIRVGMLGFGALGPMHAAALAAVSGLRLTAVCDVSAGRRDAAAALGADVVANVDELHGDGVDLVLVGTPPVTHVDGVLGALSAGKHVVCEKPFALQVDDCDRAIALAGERGLMLSVYQNRRWDPDFVRLRDVVRSGRIGDAFHMESFVGGHAHPCNYWHSEESVSGGAVFDWGSHYVDWILQLFDGPVRTVRTVSQKRMWHDVTNADHLTLEIHFESGAQAFFTHSELAAARKPKWYVLGTDGAAVGEWQEASLRSRRGPDGEVDTELLLPTDLPARVTVMRPNGWGGTDTEMLALPPRDRTAYWRNIAAHLLHGEPLSVTAEQARRTVAILEASVRSAAQDGALVTPGI